MFEPDGTTQWEHPSLPVSVGPTETDAIVEADLIPVQEEPSPVEQSSAVEAEAASSGEPVVPVDVSLPLPTGWIQVETDDGTSYYLFEADGTVQWERPGIRELVETGVDEKPAEFEVQEEPIETENESAPTAADVAAVEELSPEPEEEAAQLPVGWVQVETDDGTPYYLFEADGTVQWERPGTNEIVETGVDEKPAEMEVQEEPIVTESESPAAADVAAVEEPFPEPEEEAAPLPVGWVQVEMDDGTPYYLFEADGTTQWERPTVTEDQQVDSVAVEEKVESAAVGEPAESEVPLEQPLTNAWRPQEDSSPLPAGWAQLETDDGSPYFVFEADGTTQWERPTSTEEQGESTSVEAEAEPAEEALAELTSAMRDETPMPDEDEPEMESMPLPAGWAQLETDDGSPYFIFKADGTTQWEHPTLTEEYAEENATTQVEEEPAPSETVHPASDGEIPGDEPQLDSVQTEEENTSLPPGWVQLATDDGTPYYMFEVDGTTRWEPPSFDDPNTRTEESLSPTMECIPEAVEPTAASFEPLDEAPGVADDSQAPDLPEGWTALVDDATGTPYYFRASDNTTSWDRPTEAVTESEESGTVEDVSAGIAAAPENPENSTPETESEAIDSSYVMVEEEPPEADLPPGWIELIEDSSGMPYYLFEEDGRTQWDRPGLSTSFDQTDNAREEGPGTKESRPGKEGSTGSPVASAPEETGQEQDQALPSGWTECVDSTSGNIYYFEEATGATSWERPVAAAKPPSSYKSRKPGRPAHAVVSFGFGGRLCVLRPQPSKLNVLTIHRTFNVAPKECLTRIEQSKQQFGVVGPLNSSDNASVESYVAEKASNHDDLLWCLISIASKSSGRLRSSDGTNNANSPEVAVVSLLLDGTEEPVADEGKEFPPPSESGRTNGQSLNSVERLLLSGKREQAVEEAISCKNFTMALLVASLCSQAVYQHAAKCFADEVLSKGLPLHTIALLFAGQFHPSSWDEVAPEVLRRTWKRHLAAVISNRVEGWDETVLALGDRLMDLGDVMAAHVCFMVCGCSVGKPVSHGSRLTLLGCDLDILDLILQGSSSLEAFERTEAYEWAKRRGNPNASISSLQFFKIMYATLLADFGFVHSAKLYIDSVVDCMGFSLQDARMANSARGPFSLSMLTSDQNGLLAALGTFDERLSGPMNDAASVRSEENEADWSFVTAHTNIKDVTVSSPPPEPLSKLSSNGEPDLSRPLRPIGEDNVPTESAASGTSSQEMPSPVYQPPSPTKAADRPTTQARKPPAALNKAFDPSEANAAKQRAATPGPARSSQIQASKRETAPVSAPANLETPKKGTTPSKSCCQLFFVDRTSFSHTSLAE